MCAWKPVAGLVWFMPEPDFIAGVAFNCFERAPMIYSTPRMKLGGSSLLVQGVFHWRKWLSKRIGASHHLAEWIGSWVAQSFEVFL